MSLIIRAVSFSLALFAADLSFAQNVVSDRTAQVIAYWEPGDSRIYNVHRVKEGRKAGSTTFRVTFKVLDATDSTYSIECRYSHLKVDADLPEDARSRELMTRLMTASEGLRVMCTTDETGIPLALANEQEVAEHVRTVLGNVLDMASNDQERQQMERAFSAVLNTQVIAQSALEDIGNLLFAFGVEYELGKTETVSAQVPNPLGGAALNAIQEFTMTDLDKRGSTAHMRMSQFIDPASIAAGMDDLIRSMGGEGTSQAQQDEMRELIKTMEVADTMELEIDLKGAWTRKVRMIRVIVVNGQREVDTRTYTLR